MSDLKSETLKSSNIVYLCGCYRYVNHAEKLATMGFTTLGALLKYTPDFRFDDRAVNNMRDTYKNLIDE